MVNYRRNRVAGGTYFFTLTLKDRQANYLVEYIDDVCEAIRETKIQYKFTINAIVVLPDHIHAVLTLAEGSDNYSAVWQKIKASFTKRLVGAGCSLNKNLRGEFNLWQSRFWEHTIRDEEDFARYVDYIHYNPVKHGLVTEVKDWPFSTFHLFVKQNILSESWGADISCSPDAAQRNPGKFEVGMFD